MSSAVGREVDGNGIPFEKMLINFHLRAERKTTGKPKNIAPRKTLAAFAL